MKAFSEGYVFEMSDEKRGYRIERYWKTVFILRRIEAIGANALEEIAESSLN